jgi:hypothetical protein
MKFTYAAVVALSVLNGSNAFFSQPIINGVRSHATIQSTKATKTTTTTVSMAEDGFSEDFLEALSPGKKAKKGTAETEEEDEEEDVGSGSSRFKELLKAAQQRGASEAPRMPRAIDNPFLNPTPPSPSAMPFQPLAANPDELSVEEQARMFREMMAQQQAGAAAVQPPVPPLMDAPMRVAKTDRAGRPVGRNRDADTIANTADLYFAQLKRDSTVRALARLRGEVDVAEKVFEDEGIRQLDDLLQKNPYLKG